MTTARKTTKAWQPEIRCPHCGETELANIKYVEDITNIRNTVAFDGDTLMVEDHYTVDDDDGNDPRLCCMSCGYDFPIPAPVNVDFGDYQPGGTDDGQ